MATDFLSLKLDSPNENEKAQPQRNSLMIDDGDAQVSLFYFKPVPEVPTLHALQYGIYCHSFFRAKST
jgi:hypothetical protein